MLLRDRVEKIPRPSDEQKLNLLSFLEVKSPLVREREFHHDQDDLALICNFQEYTWMDRQIENLAGALVTKCGSSIAKVRRKPLRAGKRRTR